MLQTLCHIGKVKDRNRGLNAIRILEIWRVASFGVKITHKLI